VTTAVGGARRVYIVQPGDNLFSIGARFGRDAWAIARLNGILNLNSIYIGQPLAIP
jgi:2',3'-cyclic-nucleotide 2'-phosphodiesterase/3'-nucleotidase